MSSRAHLLLFSGFAVLFWLTIVAFILLSVQRRAKRLSARMGAMLAPHLRTQVTSSNPLRLGVRLPTGTFVQRIAKLIEYDAIRKAHHPVSWHVVALVAILPALLAERIAANYVGVVAWVIAVAAWVFACRLFFKWSDGRLAAVLYSQFPDALAMIVRSVRVGIPVGEAIKIVGREAEEPTSKEFIRVANELAIGISLDRSMRDLADRSGLPEYRFFATALALQSQTGGALSETLEGLADTIRKRVAAKSRGKALAAEARTSAMVLMGLPIVMGALLFFVNPTYMGIMIYDPSGRRLLTFAAGLLTVGSLMMRQMIRKSLA